jgi:hypothetical protein
MDRVENFFDAPQDQRPELGAMVTYDGGMAEAAKRLHLKVLAPA